MKINSKDFRVWPGEEVKLREWPTIVKPFCKSKKRYQKLLGEHVEELNSLQCLHYGDAFLDGLRVGVSSLDSGILLKCDPYSFPESERLNGPCCGRRGLSGRAHGQEKEAQN